MEPNPFNFRSDFDRNAWLFRISRGKDLSEFLKISADQRTLDYGQYSVNVVYCNENQRIKFSKTCSKSFKYHLECFHSFSIYFNFGNPDIRSLERVHPTFIINFFIKNKYDKG